MLSFVLRMSLSENRFPPRIKSGAGFFRDMRYRQSSIETVLRYLAPMIRQ